LGKNSMGKNSRTQELENSRTQEVRSSAVAEWDHGFRSCEWR
jgi:hypothetical protein